MDYSLNISMDSFTSEEEKDASNETCSLLKRIYHESRCRQIYCEQMHEFYIPEVLSHVFSYSQFTNEYCFSFVLIQVGIFTQITNFLSAVGMTIHMRIRFVAKYFF